MAKLSTELKLFRQLFEERLKESITRTGMNPPTDFINGKLTGMNEAKRIFDHCIEDALRD